MMITSALLLSFLLTTTHANGVYDKITEMLEKRNENNTDTPFYVMDIEDVINQYNFRNKFLPQISPYFSVKANPLPIVLQVLAALGSNFAAESKVSDQKILLIAVN